MGMRQYGRAVNGKATVIRGSPISLRSRPHICEYRNMTNKITTAQRMAERRAKEMKYNAVQFALALTKTLSQAAYQGICKCGLMLTERDKDSGKSHHSCPRCGWTGQPRAAAVTG